MKLIVLDEGPDHAIVIKPGGVLSVRARGGKSETILDMAEKHYGKPLLPVHRLDRPTSGCMALARTTFGQQALSDAFRKHKVDKRYLAVVDGVCVFDKLKVDARLAKSERHNKRGPVAKAEVSDDGKRALTRVNVLARSGDQSVVFAQPETGRMHQIRAHLAHLGHPLTGDTLYGGRGGTPLLLHAFLLSLPAPRGKRIFAAAGMPKRWSPIVDALGLEDILEKERTRFFP